MKRWAKVTTGVAIGLFILLNIVENKVVFTGPLQPDVPRALASADPQGAAVPSTASQQAGEATTEHSPTAEQPWQGAIAFSPPFRLTNGRNVEVEVTAPDLANAWAMVGGELIRLNADEIQPFYLETSYYHGVDDGESWSEGSHSASAYLGGIQTADYVLRAEIGWEPGKPPPALTFTVTSGVPRFSYLIGTLVFLLGLPMLTWMRSSAFEKARWDESDASDSSDDSDSSDSSDDSDDST